MSSKLVVSCCDIGYDVLTILISIADVTTDIIVLIDFYNKDRMTFFSISLVILILAQCSYAMLFTARFDTMNTSNPFPGICAFLCLLPFGTFVAFCLYFASKETGCNSFIHLLDRLSLDTSGSLFNEQERDNELVKWIKSKLEKHCGFILEAAIEAFPQSLLQIIAIVYYQEANYVSIISILLSMFSVISKSLILSQGIEKYTFIWSWFCVVADFFGIFFTVSWVFYANDLIHGDFLGYFNIFGQIFMYKFVISTLVPLVFALCVFFGFIYWFMAGGMCLVEKDYGFTCLWIILSPIIALLIAFITCLLCEVFCFSILAFAVFTFGTDRIDGYRSKHISEIVTFMLDFISKGNDKCLRLLSINKGLNSDRGISEKLRLFIDKTNENQGFEGLKKITYCDIRLNCARPKIAALFPSLLEQILDEWKNQRSALCDGDTADIFWKVTGCFAFCCICFWVLPILLISKILQILYPWIIVIYLSWNNLLFSNTIDFFQMVMLAVCIALHLLILLLGIRVMRIHKYLWHIQPGTVNAHWMGVSLQALKAHTSTFYHTVCWYPQVEVVAARCLGHDIAKIVMDYCRNIKLDDNA